MPRIQVARIPREDVSLYIAYDKNGGEDNTDDCEQNGDSDIVKRSCHILCSV